MSNHITAYPLTWPPHKPRTPASERKNGNFSTRARGDYGSYKKPLTLHQATQRLICEVSAFTRVNEPYRIDPDGLIVSTNLELRKTDGMPRAGQRTPDDPGVAVYFNLDFKDRCIPCDTYTRIEDNLAAIAATLEALRRIERHGSQMFEQAFTGFAALPSPDHVIARNWRDVLDYYGENFTDCKENWRSKRSCNHPDNGGSDDRFDEINKAWEQAKAYFNQKGN